MRVQCVLWLYCGFGVVSFGLGIFKIRALGNDIDSYVGLGCIRARLGKLVRGTNLGLQTWKPELEVLL